MICVTSFPSLSVIAVILTVPVNVSDTSFLSASLITITGVIASPVYSWSAAVAVNTVVSSAATVNVPNVVLSGVIV